MTGKSAAGPETDSLIGRKVGTIRIHKLLGEGGMGAVYAGFDERLRREVALKAVRADALTSNGRSRLLSEARVLSRLNHPNICSIYDFVTGEETDFLVLELIRGKTLREAIQKGIDPEARLGIAERIADALVAAHAQGIIHRDLKSSNVMLTWDGGVKVLDFGIARLGEDAPAGTGIDPDHTAVFIPQSEESFQFARTAPGKVVGTAGCMSPEQARGEEVSVASDMYSFGLLLQELFTGKPPYDPSLNGLDLLREVQKGRTLPVTGIDAHLAELIESLKSLAPESRPSASEALQQLRWIGGKPRRRNRMLAIGLAVLLVAAGVVKYTWDLRQERDAALHAQQETELSRRQGDEIAGFLTDLFKVSDPGEARGSTVTARELLDQGARRVRRDLRDQPPVQARLLDTIGQVYFKLGLYAEARPLLEDALRIRRAPGGDPLDLSASLEHLALLDQAQSLPEAEARFQEALRLREGKLGRRHPEVARLLNNLGVLYAMHGEYPKAEGLFREALAIREATLGPWHPDVAVSLNNLAMSLNAQGNLRQAEPLLLRGLTIRERSLPPDHPDLAANLEALAVLYDDEHRPEEAVQLHRRALAIWEKVLGPDHPRTALILTNLANALAAEPGKSGEAETLLRRAIRIREKALGSHHPQLASSLKSLAGLYRDERRYAESEALYRRALAIYDAAYPPNHPERQALLKGYASLLRATGRAREAAALLSSLTRTAP
ncbi:MAG TPA: serine/threonine-protein kinase [Thermoanaerobaculia bacterium]|nr:serine/threonine-protein kinase [Thermoanaerobaculia bacterium]